MKSSSSSSRHHRLPSEPPFWSLKVTVPRRCSLFRGIMLLSASNITDIFAHGRISSIVMEDCMRGLSGRMRWDSWMLNLKKGGPQLFNVPLRQELLYLMQHLTWVQTLCKTSLEYVSKATEPNSLVIQDHSSSPHEPRERELTGLEKIVVCRGLQSMMESSELHYVVAMQESLKLEMDR